MKKLGVKELKSLLVIVVGFMMLYFLLRLWKKESYDYLLYISLGVGFFSLLIPRVGMGIVWIWYKIAEILGWVNSRIILSALFYLFLFPISVLYRLFNKDSLQLKKQSETMFSIRNHKYRPEDLDNMW